MGLEAMINIDCDMIRLISGGVMYMVFTWFVVFVIVFGYTQHHRVLDVSKS